MVAGEVVGNDVANDLDAVVVRLSAERLQLSLGAERTGGAVELARQIQTVPLTQRVGRLHRRSLHGSEAGFGDVFEFRFDIVVFPVEAVEDVAVLNLACQAVVSLYGTGVNRCGNAVVVCARRCGGKAADCHT